MNNVALNRLVLLPRPQRMVAEGGCYPLTSEGTIAIQGRPPDVWPAATALQAALHESPGLTWPIRAAGPNPRGAGATLVVDPRLRLPVQGYQLDITPCGLQLQARDPAGAFYGVMTLRQMLRQVRGALPLGRIMDAPDFPSRGVMLDISRDKVPTLETLHALVDLLAEWKINRLELYTEHTFAYQRHREVWAQASPMTGEDILRLDAHCRSRFVELVPNQNSFGHMNRWLTLPRYRHLAECPDGFRTPWGSMAGPFSLCPIDPGSLRLLAELYAELLPHFTSRNFNVGCDETWDLGQGRSRAVCERKGKGRVYLDFLRGIHRLVRQHGRIMQFWGDIILQHPELVKELPRDVVVLEWGYEGDHPFSEHGAKFAASGIPFMVCPGTSSWCTIAGRTRNCLANLWAAAVAGRRHGAIGLLNTDWGDGGHWQYLPVSYLGFAAGAAYSWAGRANAELELPAVLDLHAFRDTAGVMGRLAYDLGNAYLRPGLLVHNCSILFDILQNGPDWKLPGRVTASRLQATREYVGAVLEPLSRARMARPDAALIQDEFRNAGRMLTHACNRATALWRGGPAGRTARRALAEEMRIILGEHRRLWMARNREGGLQDSTRNLELRLQEYSA